MTPIDIQALIRDALTNHDAFARPLANVVATVVLGYDNAVMVGTTASTRIDVIDAMNDHGQPTRLAVLGDRVIATRGTVCYRDGRDLNDGRRMDTVTPAEVFALASKMIRAIYPVPQSSHPTLDARAASV